MKSSGEKVIDTQFHFAPNYFVEHGFNNPTKGDGYSIGGKIVVPKSSGTVDYDCRKSSRFNFKFINIF